MSKLDAGRQLLTTLASLLVLFTLFALFRPSNGDGYSSRSSSKAHSLFSAKDTDHDRFSWHQCIGGAEYDNGGHDMPGDKASARQCHFKNVCVRLLPLDGMKHDTDTNATIELTYHKSPMLRGGPEIWSNWQQPDAPWLMSDRDHYLRKKDVYEPIPSSAKFVKTPTVLMGSFWPLNFGHALGDDIFPAFRLLRQFDLVRLDNYYAFHQSCRQRGGDIGCENAMAITSALTTRPYQHIGGELFPDSDTEVCFADLVMGPNALTMRSVDERGWPDMIQHMKRTVGIRPNGPLKKHRVVVIEKHGRRTWLNYKEVCEHIEQTYGVETLLVDPAKLSVPEQLKLFEETTVMLTPPGGISFSSTFLHKGAAAIYAEWWSEEKQRSFPMDQEVQVSLPSYRARHLAIYAAAPCFVPYYVWNADLHPLFFPINRSDLTLDRSALSAATLKQVPTENQLWQSYANVTIALDRLDAYLAAGFAHASKAVGIRLPPGLRGR